MNSIALEQVKKVASFNGIDVFHVEAEKFKTNSINVFFHDILNTENASKNALLPSVMRRGCERFPIFKDIALYLESLYGASFDCGVNKKGERQIIQFYIEFVSGKYIDNGTSMFEKCIELLYDIITSPVIENNALKNEYMVTEKENLKQLIEGRINDKVQYAVERCFEEMCKGEPFEIYEYGSIAELDSISPESLYQHFKSFLETLPISIFVSGELTDDMLDSLVKRFSKIKRGKIKNIGSDFVKKEVNEVKNITEKMSVSQGKLSLGFRTNTPPNDKDYYTLLVYNGILGGGMHSKLFQNVREKESLAYYAFSRLEKFKGLMIISSGIESQNRDKAQEIILLQIEELKKGNITDYEFNSTLKTIETGIRSLKDSQLQIVDYYLGQTIAGTNDNFEEIIEKVKKVSIQDVINLSQKIQLDTVFFLEAVGI